MLNKMLIEAAKKAVWSFAKHVCSFSVVYSCVFAVSLIIKVNIDWKQQMNFISYALLAFLGFTALSVVIGLITFIYKTKPNKSTLDKKIIYFMMFMPKFEYFMLSIYLVCVTTLLKGFSDISWELFFISLFALVIVSWLMLIYYFRNFVQEQIEL